MINSKPRAREEMNTLFGEMEIYKNENTGFISITSEKGCLYCQAEDIEFIEVSRFILTIYCYIEPEVRVKKDFVFKNDVQPGIAFQKIFQYIREILEEKMIVIEGEHRNISLYDEINEHTKILSQEQEDKIRDDFKKNEELIKENSNQMPSDSI